MVDLAWRQLKTIQQNVNHPNVREKLETTVELTGIIILFKKSEPPRVCLGIENHRENFNET